MVKSKWIKFLAAGMCVTMLTACGADNNPETNTPYSAENFPSETRSSEAESDESVNNESVVEEVASNDFENLICSADIVGNAVEFSDIGCKISQIKTVKTEDGGELAMQADSGNTAEDMTVTVKYSENCEFQVAKVDQVTGDATVSDGTVSDVKKEPILYIFGDFADTYNLTAAKVIIVYYE